MLKDYSLAILYSDFLNLNNNTMENVFMPEMEPKQRLQLLKDTADKIEETKYQKPLSQDDMDLRREKLTENCIRLSELEDEKKEAMAEFKEKMQPMVVENKLLLTEVKTKQQTVFGQLFHLANHESGFMETYDEDGLLVGTRRLRPDERQGSILSIARTGTND
jgi:hypothetical protein